MHTKTALAKLGILELLLRPLDYVALEFGYWVE